MLEENYTGSENKHCPENRVNYGIKWRIVAEADRPQMTI